MAILISVNGNPTSRVGFLIARSGTTRTFPVPMGLRTDDGTTVNATLQVAVGGAGVTFQNTAVVISPTETFVNIHATSQSSTPNDTVLQVVVGGAVQASFTLTAISNPQVSFKGRFQTRFATDTDKYYHHRGTAASVFKAYALEGEPDFVPAPPNADGSAHPDSVPDRIDKFVGRVIRFHNPVALRSHVPSIGVSVYAIRAIVGRNEVVFEAGDPIIGMPVNLGPGSYFAANNDSTFSSNPPPEENHPGGREPIANFEFHIGDIFSGKSLVGPYVPGTMNSSIPRSPDRRPKANHFFIPNVTSADLTKYGLVIIPFTNFSNGLNRKTVLLGEYNTLPTADRTGTANGRNLAKRISHLGGDVAAGILSDSAPDITLWKEEYNGFINDAIVINPSHSSVMSFLAGFNSFTFFALFCNFHTDELCGQVAGDVSAVTTDGIPNFQNGVYNIQSQTTAAFNALTVDQMTEANIDALLGAAPTSEKAVVSASTTLERLVISKVVIANPGDPPASWTINSRSDSLVGVFLPQASVFPRDLFYLMLPPNDQRSALGTCEGTPMAPPPIVGLARLFPKPDTTRPMDPPVWNMLLHAGTNGAAGVTYKGAWSGSTAIIPTGCTPTDVEILTPTIDFGNVEQGLTMYRQIVMLNRTAGPVTVTLPALPAPFGTPSANSVVIPAGSIGSILVSFTAGALGTTPLTPITLTSNPVVTAGLTINLTGTSVAVQTVDAVLVLDRSFSMSEPALGGFRFVSKAQLRNGAAQFFVDLLRPGDRIGLVRFNQDAQVHMALQVAGPATTGPGRMNAAIALASPDLNPAGATAIGDGMVEANALLVPPTSAFRRALVVLTDGVETADLRINAVTLAASVRAYAVGLGLPQNINVDKLSAVTGNTGGYLVVTGDLDIENEFRLHKYFAQILAGISGNNIVVDPRGVISPGETQRIPFYLSEADAHFDVVLLTYSGILEFALEAPNGTIIDSSNVGGFNGEFVKGVACRYYRMHMPVFPGNLTQGLGKWHILVYYPGERKYRGSVSGLKPDALELAVTDKQRLAMVASVQSDTSLSYNVLVSARSSINLNASIEQSAFAPGHTMSVVAYMTAFGLPLEQNVNLVAQITRPDSIVSMLPLAHRGNGRYEALLDDNKLLGLHHIVVRAIGSTPNNWPLQREHTLSGIVIRPTIASDTDDKIQEISNILKTQQDTLDKLAKKITEFLDKSRFDFIWRFLTKWLPLGLLILILILLFIIWDLARS